mmetsp:Transcript_162619/g.521351  ORF Transcript_162619/g.521351 Transcript_162619/m.521351 type:complete len:206 (+) Transcript_162619:81-698(+)
MTKFNELHNCTSLWYVSNTSPSSHSSRSNHGELPLSSGERCQRHAHVSRIREEVGHPCNDVQVQCVLPTEACPCQVNRRFCRRHPALEYRGGVHRVVGRAHASHVADVHDAIMALDTHGRGTPSVGGGDIIVVARLATQDDEVLAAAKRCNLDCHGHMWAHCKSQNVLPALPPHLPRMLHAFLRDTVCTRGARLAANASDAAVGL